MDDWKHVVFSDETKINCVGSDGKHYAWKRHGEPLSDRLIQPTVKFGGGSVMMWGCMLWEGIGYGCRTEGKMDAELYTSILEDELQNTLTHYGLKVEDVIFQQDNDPKHTSRMAKEWFQAHGYDVLICPAQSADLNPIEHLWNHVKQRLGEHATPPKGILELWQCVEAEWDKIPAEVCQKLIASMPRHIAAVYKAKGGHAKY